MQQIVATEGDRLDGERGFPLPVQIANADQGTRLGTSWLQYRSCWRAGMSPRSIKGRATRESGCDETGLDQESADSPPCF